MSASPFQVAYSSPRPVLIDLEHAIQQKKRLQPCIFCGQSHQTQSFKGKFVCLNCLSRILNLFPVISEPSRLSR